VPRRGGGGRRAKHGGMVEPGADTPPPPSAAEERPSARSFATARFPAHAGAENPENTIRRPVSRVLSPGPESGVATIHLRTALRPAWCDLPG